MSLAPGANPVGQGHERIYSSQQLVQALRSALAAVREQLQVLSILDSTAMSWPGLHQAVDDLQFLVDMSSQTTAQLEQEHSSMEASVQDIKAESATLKETLAMQNQTKEELQRKLNELGQEHRSLAAQHALSTKEAAQQKQASVLCSLLKLNEQQLEGASIWGMSE
ncbi:hypothetical protein DUNSADRAFT_3784 [Dunaliella salina]|uniref:Uncharacterized protein n=1 Tax=Dunaliella salina TaxID=3046 RepID=A0ABQ7FV59_DUNSA|nr:hypothetical protein DUNSADRAFT_3784 [Dunaliella salina]|eukprot:KAF5826275.1 hypothetical protein DUNSADRAFT_3784 [Dunaliella salina]